MGKLTGLVKLNRAAKAKYAAKLQKMRREASKKRLQLKIQTKQAKKSETPQQQASEAVKVLLKKGVRPRTRKVYHKPVFSAPRTLRAPVKRSVHRKAFGKRPQLHKWNVLQYPVTTDKAMKGIEDSNTIVFTVPLSASKQSISKYFKELYSHKPASINTTITPQGTKKHSLNYQNLLKLLILQLKLESAKRIVYYYYYYFCSHLKITIFFYSYSKENTLE